MMFLISGELVYIARRLLLFHPLHPLATLLSSSTLMESVLLHLLTVNRRMWTLLLSSFLLAPIIGSLGAPGVQLEHIARDIDWEYELLGRGPRLDARARSEKSIDAIFKSLGKQYFGSCADANLLNNAQNAEILKADFGQVTPENR